MGWQADETSRSDDRPAPWMALVAGLVVLVALAPAVTAAGTAAAVQAGGGSCPRHDTPKDSDVNGDGNDDWKVHEQSHANGELQIWCVDQDPEDDEPPHDEYFALVWVDESGDRHFVGKCPFGGGLNGGAKRVDDDGNLDRLTWVSIDRPPDDDGDGKTDDAIYQYYPANNTLIVKHSENGEIVGNRSRTPPEVPFEYGNLSPSDTSDEDFFAATEPTGEFDRTAMVAAHEQANLTVAVRNATTGTPVAGTEVEVLTTDGSAVDTLVTSEDGVAVTTLRPGRYLLSMEGAEPRMVDLRAFSLAVTLRADVAEAGDQVARLEERVDRLEAANDDLRSDLEAVRRENDRLAERVERLESDNERLAENVSALESEVADLRGQSAGGGIPGFGLLLAAAALAVAAARPLLRRR